VPKSHPLRAAPRFNEQILDPVYVGTLKIHINESGCVDLSVGTLPEGG